MSGGRDFDADRLTALVDYSWRKLGTAATAETLATVAFWSDMAAYGLYDESITVAPWWGARSGPSRCLLRAGDDCRPESGLVILEGGQSGRLGLPAKRVVV